VRGGPVSYRAEVTIGLALFSALLYGCADFFGGLASRRTRATTVVVVSQLAGVVALAIAWRFVPGHFEASDVWYGILGGVGGGLALAALYAALATGRMGIVSPVAAVIGATVPVIWGFAAGERPATTATIGVACAFIAVGLVSTDGRSRFTLREPGLVLALLSGLGIGVLYVALAAGHREPGLGRLAVVRATSLVVLASYALLRRESLRPARESVRLILLAGTLDMGANVLYVAALRNGALAIVAVLTSLYPASTVFLARVVLGERLVPVQWAGVAFAALGVALIAR